MVRHLPFFVWPTDSSALVHVADALRRSGVVKVGGKSFDAHQSVRGQSVKELIP